VNMTRHFEAAIKHHEEMDAHLCSINVKLRQAIGDEVTLHYQPGDGWCILFDNIESYNAPISPSELEELFVMTKEDAIAFLTSKSI
jgi:hypothetical protein